MKNQLGLKIVRAYQGESVLHQVNANEAWVNKVGEAREWIPYVEDWNKLTQTEMIVLSTIESGQFLTIFSGISGRGKDYITAWIYVPNSIRIMGSQLVDIVSAITKELKTNRVNKENLDKFKFLGCMKAPLKKLQDKYIKQMNNFYDNIEIDQYVIMPNHIHLIVDLGMSESRRGSLPLREFENQNNIELHNVIGRMKSYTTRQYRILTGNQKAVLWQRNFYEHVIRNDEDYAEKWQYIDENALKWNLEFDY